jgi:hypothetical protein
MNIESALSAAEDLIEGVAKSTVAADAGSIVKSAVKSFATNNPEAAAAIAAEPAIASFITTALNLLGQVDPPAAGFVSKAESGLSEAQTLFADFL